MTFKIEDKVMGSQKELIVSSTILWFNFQEQVAKTLNVHPSNLQLQYHLSNAASKSLPFDLNSHVMFGSMCTKLKPFVVPPTLKNGKKSTYAMKLITVKLFNGDTGREAVRSGVKNSKVMLLYISSCSNALTLNIDHTDLHEVWHEYTRCCF